MPLLIMYVLSIVIIGIIFYFWVEDLTELTIGEILITLGLTLVPIINSAFVIVLIAKLTEESGILEKQPFKKKEPNDNTTV